MLGSMDYASGPASIRIGVVDVEVVELPRRAVAAERFRISVDLCLLEKLRELLEMFAPHLLLNAVGPEARNLAAHEELGLVDRIPERLGGISEHHEMSGLGHESRHVADRTAHDDVDPLHGDAAAGGGVPLDDQKSAIARGPRGFRGIAFDPDEARHHVLGDADASVAIDDDFGLLVHAAGIEA